LYFQSIVSCDFDLNSFFFFKLCLYMYIVLRNCGVTAVQQAK